ncbi:MAG: A/G-specific adenine glycosylase, partial [Roseburia sp.]
MREPFDLTTLIEPLLNWFKDHARVLPWRNEPTPYRVWVSEIMLQQTRVEAVKPYFDRFLKELPDVAALSDCPEEKLLKLWEGLGYYNRVRNMQIAAQTVMENYHGELPADYEALTKLKGIGHYTAGAIASIAFGIPVPAVDGNVLRVISRVTEDDADIMKASVRTAMEKDLLEIMPENRAGAFNQAL